MSNKTILIIEDEERMRRLIKDYLNREGYKVIEASDGKIAIDTFKENKVDLVILDIMLPQFDGWTVCREIRKNSDVPIVMLTARSEESDQLFGFDLGADQYITKPFSPKILVAKVKVLLKRSSITNEDILTLNEISIDRGAHRVYIKDSEVELSPKEYDLLSFLVENKGKALEREQILNSVWGYAYYGDTRTVDTHVKRLRAKLDDKGEYIETVRGIGYRFEVK